MVNPSDIAGNTEEEEEEEEEECQLQRYSWECRRKRRMVNSRDIAGNTHTCMCTCARMRACMGVCVCV